MSTVIITGSTTLRVLDVNYNDISDERMAVISEALQQNKSFTTLGVLECGLSVKGTVVCVLEMYFFNNQIIMKLLNTLYAFDLQNLQTSYVCVYYGKYNYIGIMIYFTYVT